LRYCHGIARGEYSLLVQKILGVDALAEVVSCIEFKLTPKLPIEKASSGRTIGQFDREYPNMNDICRVCGKRFGQHHGFECLEDKS